MRTPQRVSRSETGVTVGFSAGPDRFAIAMALLDEDTISEGLHTIRVKLDEQIGDVSYLTLQIHGIERESGSSVKLWCFKGSIGGSTHAKLKEPITMQCTGFLNLNDRTGWIRFHTK